MKLQLPVTHRQPPSIATQAQDQTEVTQVRLPSRIMLHSPFPTSGGAPWRAPFPGWHPSVAQHTSAPHSRYPPIPAYDFAVTAGPRPVMAPQLPFLSGRHDRPGITASSAVSSFPGPSIVSQASPRSSASHVSPKASRHLGPKQSRLPPDTVARKAPRKSSVAPTRPAKLKSTSKVSKEKSKSKSKSTTPRLNKSSSKLKDTRSSPVSSKKTSQDVTLQLQQSVSVADSPIPSECARHTVAVQDRKMIQDEDNKLASPLPCIETQPRSEKGLLSSPVTTRQQTHTSKDVLRPQSRYKYEVPSELNGVKRALGEDDWTEHLVLMEKLVLEEVTEKEYNATSRRIFQIMDGKLHGKIQSMVKRMVTPVIERNRAISGYKVGKEKPQKGEDTKARDMRDSD